MSDFENSFQKDAVLRKDLGGRLAAHSPAYAATG